MKLNQQKKILLYLYKSGSKAMNYIIIKGELKPIDFMNSLANKLKKKWKEKYILIINA